MTKTLNYSEIRYKLDASNRSLKAVLEVKYQETINPEAAVQSYLLGNIMVHLVNVLSELPAKKAATLLETIIRTNAAVAEAVAIKRI